MFGGNASSFRKSRLIAASPYAGSANASRRPHQRPLFDEPTTTSSSRRGSSAANTPSPAPSPSPSSTTSDNGTMSSTARLIFDTLEKMSTPVRDAQKLIPSVSSSPPRSEKRRLIAEQLDWAQDSLKRRRPNLSASSRRDQLNGPPLRTIFSPVPASSSPRPRSSAAKSARLTPSRGESSGPPQQRNLGLTFSNSTKPSPKLGASTFMSDPPSRSSKADLLVVNESQPSKPKEPVFNNSHSGKIRAKVTEPVTRQRLEPKSVPTPNFLSAAIAPLPPLKDLPTFEFPTSSAVGKPEKNALVSRSSTASTLPLSSPSKPTSPLKGKANLSFQFSIPSPVKSTAKVNDVMSTNGITFNFCHPTEVVAKSFSETLPSLVHKNHATTLPDLTMGQQTSSSDSTGLIMPAKTLTAGSVLDILKRKSSNADR